MDKIKRYYTIGDGSGYFAIVCIMKTNKYHNEDKEIRFSTKCWYDEDEAREIIKKLEG